MSGVPIPLSSRVAVPEGGKLAGMRTMVVSMPRASSTSQNGVAVAQQLDPAAVQRELPRPSVSMRPGGTVRDVDRNGSSSSGRGG